MTRDEKIEQMRKWLHSVDEASLMVSKTMRRNGVVTVRELAEKHPKQFNSLFAAIQVMEEELPEPDFPWPMP